MHTPALNATNPPVSEVTPEWFGGDAWAFASEGVFWLGQLQFVVTTFNIATIAIVPWVVISGWTVLRWSTVCGLLSVSLLANLVIAAIRSVGSGTGAASGGLWDFLTRVMGWAGQLIPAVATPLLLAGTIAPFVHKPMRVQLGMVLALIIFAFYVVSVVVPAFGKAGVVVQLILRVVAFTLGYEVALATVRVCSKVHFSSALPRDRLVALAAMAIVSAAVAGRVLTSSFDSTGETVGAAVLLGLVELTMRITTPARDAGLIALVGRCGCARKLHQAAVMQTPTAARGRQGTPSPRAVAPHVQGDVHDSERVALSSDGGAGGGSSEEEDDARVPRLESDPPTAAEDPRLRTTSAAEPSTSPTHSAHVAEAGASELPVAPPGAAVVLQVSTSEPGTKGKGGPAPTASQAPEQGSSRAPWTGRGEEASASELADEDVGTRSLAAQDTHAWFSMLTFDTMAEDVGILSSLAFALLLRIPPRLGGEPLGVADVFARVGAQYVLELATDLAPALLLLTMPLCCGVRWKAVGRAQVAPLSLGLVAAEAPASKLPADGGGADSSPAQSGAGSALLDDTPLPTADLQEGASAAPATTSTCGCVLSPGDADVASLVAAQRKQYSAEIEQVTSDPLWQPLTLEQCLQLAVEGSGAGTATVLWSPVTSLADMSPLQRVVASLAIRAELLAVRLNRAWSARFQGWVLLFLLASFSGTLLVARSVTGMRTFCRFPDADGGHYFDYCDQMR